MVLRRLGVSQAAVVGDVEQGQDPAGTRSRYVEEGESLDMLPSADMVAEHDAA